MQHLHYVRFDASSLSIWLRFTCHPRPSVVGGSTPRCIIFASSSSLVWWRTIQLRVVLRLFLWCFEDVVTGKQEQPVRLNSSPSQLNLPTLPFMPFVTDVGQTPLFAAHSLPFDAHLPCSDYFLSEPIPVWTL
ncbi:hypothetical protein BD309DRAFT_1024604 [Dichomitus squalens]|nr:hypothetical protein BD309DRAFT_1024604 [Dichomitus squalens]